MISTMLLLATAQAATPAPPTAEPKKTIVREIVIREGKDGEIVRLDEEKGERHRIMILRDGDQEAKPGERREVRVLRRSGEPGARITMLGDCKGDQKVTSDTEADKDGVKERTRILICNASGGSTVGQVQRLRNTIKSIEADKDLSAETKTRVITALNNAIAALPASE